MYFEAGGQLEEAARRLHIHVSTLRYRLTRRELLDVDLKDSSAALDMQVALKAAAGSGASRLNARPGSAPTGPRSSGY